jgi:hypothetical protein
MHEAWRSVICKPYVCLQISPSKAGWRSCNVLDLSSGCYLWARITAGTPAILTAVFRDIPQSHHSSTSIMLLSLFSRSFPIFHSAVVQALDPIQCSHVLHPRIAPSLQKNRMLHIPRSVHLNWIELVYVAFGKYPVLILAGFSVIPMFSLGIIVISSLGSR